MGNGALEGLMDVEIEPAQHDLKMCGLCYREENALIQPSQDPPVSLLGPTSGAHSLKIADQANASGFHLVEQKLPRPTHAQ